MSDSRASFPPASTQQADWCCAQLSGCQGRAYLLHPHLSLTSFYPDTVLVTSALLCSPLTAPDSDFSSPLSSISTLGKKEDTGLVHTSHSPLSLTFFFFFFF